MMGGGGGAVGHEESSGLLSGSSSGSAAAASRRQRPTAPPPPSAAASGARLGLATAQYVCCSLISTTLFYRELYRLQKFPQFSNQLNTAGTSVTMGILVFVLIAQLCSTTEGVGGWLCSLGLDSMHFGEGLHVILGGRLFSGSMLVFLGFLNSLGNLLQLMAIDGLGPRYSTLTTLINQCTIPFTMLLSRVLLRNRYSGSQLLGAAIVIGGVGIAVWPSLGSEEARSASGAQVESTYAVVVVWICVFVVSCFPQSLLNVLIERSLPLEQQSLELAYTSTKGVPQLRDVLLRTVALVSLMNIASVPFNFFGGIFAALLQHGDVAPFWEDYQDGWDCLNGRDSASTGANECLGAWIDVLAFIPMGGLYIVSQILLIHFASASYMFLATAFLLPLQNVVLSWRLVMGAKEGTVTATTFVAIGVVSLGMLVYAYSTQQQKLYERKLREDEARGASVYGIQR